MGIEGDGDAGSLVLASTGHHLIKEHLVAQMHPIEVADGDMGTLERMSDVC